MMTLDELKNILSTMNLKQVARDAGVHYNAIYRLMNGGTNPSYETVQKIIAHLESKGIVK